MSYAHAEPGAEGRPRRLRDWHRRVARHAALFATGFGAALAICVPLAPAIASDKDGRPGVEAAAEDPDAALILRLQKGGVVVFLRTAETDETSPDARILDQRDRQRTLTRGGRMQAAILGAAFETLDIRPGRVLSSPLSRARDTAELAFGRGDVEVTRILGNYCRTAGCEVRHQAAIQGLLTSPPPEGRVTVLVGHRTSLERATGQAFPEAELPDCSMAVFDPQESGPRLLGILEPHALLAAAAQG
ncbi:histidine phosphatase family protein [Mesobaculum littorinae]|nr:histidine phosphatase family protein [Mesobaculum littorinae]